MRTLPACSLPVSAVLFCATLGLACTPASLSAAPTPAEPALAAGSAADDSLELTWSLRRDAGAGQPEALLLEYRVTARQDAYVADRPWVEGARASARVADPQGIYRFVDEGALWLVMATSPLPPAMEVANVYPPRARLLAAGDSLQRSIRIEVPVLEYSALARRLVAATTDETVSRAHLVLAYQRAAALPAPPPLDEEIGGVIVSTPSVLVTTAALGEPVAVRRRVEAIGRFQTPATAG